MPIKMPLFSGANQLLLSVTFSENKNTKKPQSICEKVKFGQDFN